MFLKSNKSHKNYWIIKKKGEAFKGIGPPDTMQSPLRPLLMKPDSQLAKKCRQRSDSVSQSWIWSWDKMNWKLAQQTIFQISHLLASQRFCTFEHWIMVKLTWIILKWSLWNEGYIGKSSLKDEAHWVYSLIDLQIYNQNRHTSRLDSLLSVVASAVVVRGNHSVGSTCNHLCTHHQSVLTAIKQH